MSNVLKAFVSVFIVSSVFWVSACQTDRFVTPSEDITITRIYLVRHAEKTTQKIDPGLTSVGQERANALADLLEDVGITHIYSSDYNRTRETARPLAERFELDIEIYDPRDLSTLAEKLKTMTGSHLVIGHSNTTPQLVELLGGEGGSPIIEATEYNRLYLVQISEKDAVSSKLMRYGAGQD